MRRVIVKMIEVAYSIRQKGIHVHPKLFVFFRFGKNSSEAVNQRLNDPERELLRCSRFNLVEIK